MASQGPNGATVAADDAAVGTVDWTGVGNLALNTDLEASAALADAAISKYAKCTGYGFTVPSTATILGVVATAGRRTDALGVADDLVKLVKAGTVGGSSKNVAGDWPLIQTRQSYGSPTDLWGNTLAPADVNDVGFGVAISGVGTGAGGTGYLQRPGITIYYYDPPPVGSDAPSGAGSGVSSVTIG
jgi:hypothetical protein